MEIELPSHFEIEYEPENQKYYSEPYKSSLKNIILKESEGYCMYCGKRILIDDSDFSHVEHSVDKKGNFNQEDEFFLEHCKFNLAVACPKCNLVYKKKIEKIDISDYKNKECDEICGEECKDYLKLKDEYQKRNYMYIAPRGYKKGNQYATISYDLIKNRYVPSNSTLKDDELTFITNNQTDRFALNEEMFSFSITDTCGMIIDLIDSGIDDCERIVFLLKRMKYDNILGVKFIDYLSNIVHNNKVLTAKKLRDMCEMILILDLVSL